MTSLTTDPELAKRIQDEINNRLDNEWIGGEAERVAKRFDAAHRERFFRALASTLGATLIGDGRPDGRGRVYTAFSQKSGIRVRKSYNVPINIEPSLFIDEFAKENVLYIGTVRDNIVKGIQDQVVREVTFGTGDPRELQRKILRKWKASGVPSQIPIANGTRTVNAEKHALFIANDQLAKLNSQLTRSRQLASGIRKSSWQTQRDNKVRQQHRAFQGVVFNTAEGIGGTFPGMPVACRCWAKAEIDVDELAKEWDENISPNEISFGITIE